MEDLNLECTEVLTPESLAVEMMRTKIMENNDMLEALLSIWKQGGDAASTTDIAHEMLVACFNIDRPCFPSPDYPDTTRCDDVNAAHMCNEESTGFIDFYGSE